LTELQKRQVCISTYKVSKTFKRLNKAPVHALFDVTLHLATGEIVALAGENDSGKTTLLRILTGVAKPTEGIARLLGCDTANPLQMTTVRPFLGVCRQADVGFKRLTIYEHLYFFAIIKGLAPTKIPRRIERFVKSLDLEEHMNTLFAHLPKGNKRKVCFLMALIGDPKILLLDDPASSLDPIGRRKMWSLLKRNQEERICILHLWRKRIRLPRRKHFISSCLKDSPTDGVCHRPSRLLNPQALQSLQWKTKKGDTAALPNPN